MLSSRIFALAETVAGGVGTNMDDAHEGCCDMKDKQWIDTLEKKCEKKPDTARKSETWNDVAIHDMTTPKP